MLHELDVVVSQEFAGSLGYGTASAVAKPFADSVTYQFAARRKRRRAVEMCRGLDDGDEEGQAVYSSIPRRTCSKQQTRIESLRCHIPENAIGALSFL